MKNEEINEENKNKESIKKFQKMAKRNIKSESKKEKEGNSRVNR